MPASMAARRTASSPGRPASSRNRPGLIPRRRRLVELPEFVTESRRPRPSPDRSSSSQRLLRHQEDQEDDTKLPKKPTMATPSAHRTTRVGGPEQGRV